MTPSRLALGLTFAATALLVGFLSWLLVSYSEDVGVVVVFLGTPLILKVFALLGLTAVLAAVVIGLTSLSVPLSGVRGGSSEILLWLTTAGGLGFGFFGWAHAELSIRAAIIENPDLAPVSFAVLAPLRAEGILCLTVGSCAALVSLIFQEWLDRRRRALLAR